ncbi:MAG: hypothetical protein IKX86_01205, partial [Clostridia bacterium]|nr:hypothetical protein [Clostridia bacterium]
KKYVQHPNYGFVPKPGTEIISEVRSSGNFNFSDAESFLDQFRIVDEKINSIESDATFAEEVFSYYYHVATLMSPRNGWFFLSTDFNGNDINDAQSFENYVSFLDSVCQQKAKENGIVHWESCGYRGFLDSDDEILKGCCLGY